MSASVEGILAGLRAKQAVAQFEADAFARVIQVIEAEAGAPQKAQSGAPETPAPTKSARPRVRKAKKQDEPKSEPKERRSRITVDDQRERVAEFLHTFGPRTRQQIADNLGLSYQGLGKVLDDPRFTKGEDRTWGLAMQASPENANGLATASA